jgi:two-component system cell cycle response regulator
MPNPPRQPPSATRVLAGALAALVFLALATLTAHTLFGFGTPRFSYFIEEWVYDFITLTAAVVTLGRAALRQEQRIAWALLGIGLLFWAAGDLYWTVALRDLADPPFPSLDDALYLAGYPFVLAGLVAFVRSRVGRIRAVVWADVAMGAFCVAAIGSALLLDFVLANETGTPFEIAVAVAYPALDLIILAVVAGAVALTGWRPGRSLTLIAAGIACAGLADSVYTYQTLAGTYDVSDWNNFLWPLATVLIAVGAVQPAAAHRETEPPAGWRAFASPTVFALAVLSLVVLERQDVNQPVVAAFTIATLVALMIRVALAFHENHRLVRELETDSLTGLLNRGKLLYDLDRLLNADDPAPHVLAIFDLDGFKAYNDSFGHPAGDALLFRLGRQLAAAVGNQGHAYRMGGDEFAVVIPGRSSGARGTVEAGVAALTDRGEGFQVTCSCGVAELPSEAGNRDAAVQLADQRMYADKDSRRQSAGGEVEAVLVRILNQRAPELGEHVNAVKRLALAVGEDLDLSPGELTALGQASELHDIGKIAIPDEILVKPGPLDEEELRFMRQHTVMGERIVSAAPSLAPLGKLIRASHERWDGKGYPDGLAGSDIPLAARIIAACDAYDAITSDRPYADALGPEEAVAELRRVAGTQFDPQVVASVERIVRGAREKERVSQPA